MSATAFSVPINNYQTTLASSYAAGAGTAVLATGAGAALGTLSATRWARLTFIKAGGIDTYGNIIDTTKLRIFKATGLTGDTLSGMTAIEGTTDNLAFAAGDYVVVEITAGNLSDIHTAINNLESATMTIDGTKTFSGSVHTGPDPILVNATSAGSAAAQLEVTAKDSSTPILGLYNHADALMASFDPSGVLGFNFGASGISGTNFLNISPNDTYNANFYLSFASFANNGTDPHRDGVLAIGYNTDGTTRVDLTKPACSTNLESYYVPSGLLGGTPQFEYHAAQVQYADGTIKRPWSVSMPYDKSAIAHAITMNTMTWEKLDGTQAMLWTWPTLELLNNTTILQNVNNLAWLNQRATDGSTDISLAMVDGFNRTVFGEVGWAAYLPGSSVTIDGPVYLGENVGVGTVSPNVSGQAGNVRVVTSSGTDTGGFGGFEVNTLSTSVDALAGYYGFTASGQTANYRLPAFIGAWLEGSTAGKLGASLRFHTQPDNTAGAVERFRVTSNGYFLVNQTASGLASAQFEITPASSSTVAHAIYLPSGYTADVNRVINNAGSTIWKLDAAGRVTTTALILSRKTVSSATTLLATDPSFIAITSTGAAYALTLPAANTVPPGFTFTFKDEGGNAGTNNITVSPAGTDTAEAALVLASNYAVLRIYSDGVSKWFKL